MASPPAGSPPGSSGLALPRQRPPTLALPSKSRKPSLAPSSAHPLRQTSFPPPDRGLSLEQQHLAAQNQLRAYSPGEEGSLDEFSDTEIQSAISGPVGGADEAFSKKRKRGEKRSRGRPSKRDTLRAGSASLVNGEDGRSTKRGTTAGAASIVTNGNEDDEDDDDDDDAATGAATNAGIIDAAELEKDNQNRYLFREAVEPMHQNRYDSFNKVKLRKEDVRRLVNQTLSQSVPQNVVHVVSAYTKMFAGMLVEGAREVQAEWMAAHPTLADGETANRAYKRMRLMQPPEEESESESDDEGEEEEKEVVKGEDEGEAVVKSEEKESPTTKLDEIPDGTPGSAKSKEPSSSSEVPDSQPKEVVNGNPKAKAKAKPKPKPEKNPEEEFDDLQHIQPGAWSLAKYIEEPDRGPLLPDHLREALRRYKSSMVGGSVGFTGLSLARPEVVAPRTGGRRLFK